MQSGEHAIGGEGTSAFMPAAYQADASTGRDLGQEFNKTDPRWRFEMDFAAEEPDGQGTDDRTVSLGWRTDEGNSIFLIVTGNGDDGASGDGLGDVQLYDAVNKVYFTPAEFEDIIVFDDDVQQTPLTHHLRVDGDFTADEPYYDVHITDPSGTVHSAMGIKLFHNGTPSADAGIVWFADNTFRSTGDHLIDNVRIGAIPEPAAAALLSAAVLLGLATRGKR
jgi:hypothetical protein